MGVEVPFELLGVVYHQVSFFGSNVSNCVKYFAIFQLCT